MNASLRVLVQAYMEADRAWRRVQFGHPDAERRADLARHDAGQAVLAYLRENPSCLR